MRRAGPPCPRSSAGAVRRVCPPQGVATLLEVALGFHGAAVIGLVGHAQHVQGLVDAAVVGDCLSELGRVAVAGQHPDHVVRPHRAGVDRGDHPQDVLPVPTDLLQVDPATSRSVERAIVSAGVHLPQLLIGQVGQLRGVGPACQREESEDDVAVGGGIGHDGLRPDAAVAVVEHVQYVQRVPRSAGHDLRAEPGGLVVDHVQPGRALAGLEVLRVVAGMHRVDRHHEPHPVHAGDVPAAPHPRQPDVGLGLDQSGVGGPDGVQPQVVRVDVCEPVAGQRRHARFDHRPPADVARLGDQQRRDRHMQIGQAGIATGDRGERLVGAGPGEHLQQHLGQVDPRQHPVGDPTQVDQARRVRLGLQRFQVSRPSSSKLTAAFCGSREATSR